MIPMDQSQELYKRLDEIDRRLTTYLDLLDKRTQRFEKETTIALADLEKRFAYLEKNTVTRKEYNEILEKLERIARNLRSL